MWIFFAFASAFFAGLTAILAKVGLKNTDADLATMLRTIVVLAFSWLIVMIVGSQNTIGMISSRSLVFLLLSGLATGASWLCYFKALQLGSVNKVTPVDKCSTILTILLAFLFLGESPTLWGVIGIFLLLGGTWLMVKWQPGEEGDSRNQSWLIYALLSIVFAALTTILGKIGIEEVESNLGTAIRTVVVLLLALAIVFARHKLPQIKHLDRRSLLFITASGLATGASWLCYFKALQTGKASVVAPIDKLSIVVTIAFSCLFLGERLSRRSFYGLLLVVAGTLLQIL
jgi:bacterial/archaeal transporter family protein